MKLGMRNKRETQKASFGVNARKYTRTYRE